MRERSPDRRLDLLLAGALLALGQLEVALRGTGGNQAAAHLVWAAAAVAVLWRRAHPLLFFGWAMVVHALASIFDVAPQLAAIYALYTPLALFGLGAYARDSRRAAAAAVLGLGGVMAVRLGLDLTDALSDRSADEWLREAGIFAPAAAGGVILRDRTDALRSARERVRAAASGAAAVDLALTVERTRIARELHAVVSGCVRAVLDEVALARSTLAARSGAARSALGRARRASQQAMSEMRRMLVLLRSEAPPPLRDAAGVPASLRELALRESHGDQIAVRRAHPGVPAPEEPMPPGAMRVLVALAELPGCARLTVERGFGVVRASARVVGPLDAARAEALAERARLAGGRLRRGRVCRRRLHIVLPVDPHEPPAPRYRHAWVRVVPLLRAQGIPLLLLAIELSEALLAAGRPAEFYGTATVPERVAGAVAISLAFLPRRRWPVATVFAVVAIAAVRSLGFDEAFGLNPPLFLAAFVAGAYARSLWLAALAGVVTAGGGVAIVGLLFGWDWQLYAPSVYLFFVTMVAAAWITGVGGRRRLAEAAELRALAAEEERLQAAAIARTVNAERLRVARELHDLVGHGLTSITLQCAVADQLLDTRPAGADAALAAVAEVGEEVVRELQQLLAALDGSRDGRERRETATPPLARLTELARRAQAQGLAVRLELAGDLDALPAGHAGAAYRIVQEALTNARKHGGAVAVGARVAHEPGRLAIEVRNPLVAAATSTDSLTPVGSGLGLTGMRERVRLYDGRLTAGLDADGDWVVRAELPVPA